MPDLVTHVSVAYFLRKPKGISRFTVIFFLGTILPDVLTRPIYVIFPNTYWFVYPFHTPLVLVLVSLLISYFFQERIRKAVFITLLLGVLLHLLLDLFQRSLFGTNYWLFPISDIDIQLGLFWQDDSLYAIPFLACIIFVREMFSLLRSWRK